MSNLDADILALSLKAVTLALNDLCKDCTGENGKPKPPSMTTLMRSKGYLPSYCDQSLSKKRGEANG